MIFARFLGVTGALEQQFNKIQGGRLPQHALLRGGVNQGGTAGYVSSL